MKNAFDKLKKISSDYKNAVDALAPDYQSDGARDHLWSEAEQARRKTERNAAYNAEIDKLARKAQEQAAPVIAELREAVQRYITSSTDPATLTTLQGLIAAGVALTDAEINAFAQKGGYGVLRLLERPSRGHVKAPVPEVYEKELQELERYFRDIKSYRGGLAAISTDRPWGQYPAVGNVIAEGKINGFAGKVDGFAERWAVLEH